VRWLLPINIFVQFLAGPTYIPEGFFQALLHATAWLTLVIGPFLLLLLIQVQFLPYHRGWLTGAHRQAIHWDFGLWFMLWPIVLGLRPN